jgi:hypothetical protein
MAIFMIARIVRQSGEVLMAAGSTTAIDAVHK